MMVELIAVENACRMIISNSVRNILIPATHVGHGGLRDNDELFVYCSNCFVLVRIVSFYYC